MIVLLSKEQILACPSHSLLGHPLLSVLEEGTLSQSTYETEAVFYLCCSEEALDWQLPEKAAVLQTECFCDILPAVSCTEIQS